jgi:hypothetical protein
MPQQAIPGNFFDEPAAPVKATSGIPADFFDAPAPASDLPADRTVAGIPGTKELGLPGVPIVTGARVEPVSKWAPVTEPVKQAATAHAVKSLGGATATEIYDNASDSLSNLITSNIRREHLPRGSQSIAKFTNQIVRGVPEIIDFMFTPMGAATAKLQVARPLIRTAVNAAFATDMGLNAKEALEEAAHNPTAENNGRAVKATITALLPFLHSVGEISKTRQIQSQMKNATVEPIVPERGPGAPYPAAPRMNRAQRRATAAVPEEGISESVARGVAAREDLAAEFFQKPFGELGNKDRIAIDELIAERNAAGRKGIPQDFFEDAPTPKQPHQMTLPEYTSQFPNVPAERLRGAHEHIVAEAVRSGKEVPADVLADHPTVQKGSPSPTTAAETPKASPLEPAAASVVAEANRGGEGVSLWDRLETEARAEIEKYALPEEQGGFLKGETGTAAQPALYGAYLKLGVAKVGRGVTDFGKWSAEMVREFGDAVKPHLTELYGKAQQGMLALKDLHAEDYLNFDRLNISDAAKESLKGRVIETVIRTGRFPKEVETFGEVKARAAEMGPEALKALPDWQKAQPEYRAVVFAAREQAAHQNQRIYEETIKLEKEVQSGSLSPNEILERQKTIDGMEKDNRELLNVGMRMASETGRNLAMYRAMAADTSHANGGFDLTFWLGKAKRDMGIPAGAELPVDKAKGIERAVAEGAKAVEQATRRQLNSINNATLKKQGVEPVPSGQKLTPEQKAAVDADPRVIAARRRLAQTMVELNKTGTLEAISAFRKAGLLTGVKTHLRNIGGNTAFQLMEEVARVPASVVDMAFALYSKQRTIHGTSPESFAKATRYAATEGVKQAKSIWKTGMTQDQLAKMVDIPREVATGNKVFDSYVNHVFRLLSAEDRVYKAYAMQRSLREQAWVAVKNKTAGGRNFEDLVQHPTESMQVQAIADAEFATFNNKNLLASALRQGQTSLNEKGIPGKATAFAIDIAIPFANTPANIMARMFDYTPIGSAGRVPVAVYKSIVDGALSPAEQRTISLSIGRGLTGTALLYMGYRLAASGQATGMRSKEAGERNVDDAAGRPAGAVLVGGRWHQVAPFSPQGNLIVLGATMFHDKDKGPAKLVGAGTNIILEQPMLKGMNDVLESLKNPDRSAESVTSSTVGSFVPTLVADAAALIDHSRRISKPENFGQALYRGIESRIPGVRQALPERLDVLGRPMTQEQTQAVDPTLSQSAKELTDPLLKELVVNKVKIGFPEKLKFDPPGMTAVQIHQAKKAGKTPEKVEESEEEYRLRSALVGRIAELRISQLIRQQTYQNLMPGDMRKERIESAVNGARTEAGQYTTHSGRYMKASTEERQKILQGRIDAINRKIESLQGKELPPVPGSLNSK